MYHPQIKSQARGIVTAERDQLKAISHYFSCAKNMQPFLDSSARGAAFLHISLQSFQDVSGFLRDLYI